MLSRFVRLLLVTPPMVQFNTAYPAMPMLASFVRAHGHEVAQADLSLGLALRLYSKDGLAEVVADLRGRFRDGKAPDVVKFLLRHGRMLIEVIPDLIAFQQERTPDRAAAIAKPSALPEGPRWKAMRDVPRNMDTASLARHRASILLDEIADAVREGIDSRFELARYAEHLAADAASFSPLHKALSRQKTLVDRWIDDLADAEVEKSRPDVVGCTVPFPGTLYAAFRIAKRAKALRPAVKTVLGGGYVNTELRALAEPRVFETFDFLSYDDGEIPLLRILDSLQGKPVTLVRTALLKDGKVAHVDDPAATVLRHRDRTAPDFRPMRDAGYLAMAESPNPMHRLWTERPWIKLTLAHGCYWHRCAFCDTSLDYIRRYDPANASTIVDWMEKAIADTGLSGFHFVDEAAPPALLGNLSKEILRRGLRVEFWANIRFERQFTPELSRLLKQAGCIAATGGLECAQDRLLELLDKGIDTDTARQAMAALSGAGILVHAYLIYGYPTQTVEETLQALDFVRGLFADGVVQSAYYHRFALTVHSPAFRDATKLGLKILDDRKGAFGRNEVPFQESRMANPDLLGKGLGRAVYNFMHGVGLEHDVASWFDFPIGPRKQRTGPGRGPLTKAPTGH
jgi:radical SAM superfamily enzyme YgiQ (UPF0313 family)